MKKFDKHNNEPIPPIIRADFSGGLNTAAQVDGIAENQLAKVLNMEVEIATGKLQTVAGTKDILTAENIFAAIYDSINNLILVVKNDRKIYLADFDGNISSTSIGSLSGNLYPKYCAWENGVLIASGGNVQYFDGANLKLLNTSPILSFDGKQILIEDQLTKAENVFARNGRVCFTCGTKIYYSGAGDENDWIQKNYNKSASKSVEVGYKDGGNFIGVESLSQDIFVIKENKIAYRLSGEYPNWQVTEVANKIECSGRRSICKVGDDVFVVGENEACLIQNNFYGNIKPENLAEQVKSEIQKLPRNAAVKYLSSKWQVWILGSEGNVLVFDVRLKSWWKRKFNAEILDVFEVGDEIYLVKADRISKLDNDSFKDNGEYMNWEFMAQRLTGRQDLFLKHSKISVTPLHCEHYDGQIYCGRVELALPIPDKALKICGNDSPIYRNATKIMNAGRNRGYILPQPPNKEIFRDKDILQENHDKIFANNTYVIESRNVFRNKYLDITGRGQGGRFILQSIVLDVVEV